MALDELVSEFTLRFNQHGSFSLRKEERISKVLKENRVPDEPGVYLIYGKKGEVKELLYIGRAGTLLSDGAFTDQKLYGRLKNRQNGMRRQEFYQRAIDELSLDALCFKWFVTFDESSWIIPATAEANLIQAFYEKHGRLPLFNERY